MSMKDSFRMQAIEAELAQVRVQLAAVLARLDQIEKRDEKAKKAA